MPIKPLLSSLKAVCTAAVALLLALAVPAGAAEAGPSDEEAPPFTRTERVVYTVRSQSLYDTESTIEFSPNTWETAESLAQQRERVNKHFEDFEIIEAATLKADGRRLNVPASKILTQRGNNEATLFDADEVTYTMIFADVAPGDRIRYVVRRKQKRERLPGGFTLSEWAIPTDRYTKFEVAVNLPANMLVYTHVLGFTPKEARREGNRIIHEWTLDPLSYSPREQTTVSVLDYGPHVMMSSFKDIQAASDAFCVRAVPKSEVTPAITAQAGKITEGIADRREQARAILNWVSANIRYVAISLGSGGMVPNPAASILNNRYGDCKDYATLMRSLLAAKGIQSELVEINASPVYKLLPIPSQHYNHVILYIPEFELFVDPTAKYSTFDRLPDTASNKHTRHCGVDGKARVSRVPPTSETVHTIAIAGHVTVRPDGSAEGSVAVTGQGSGAEDLRIFMARLERGGREAVLRPMFDTLNVNGTGKIEGPRSLDRTEPYTVKMSFIIDDSHFGEANSMLIGAGPEILNEPYWTLQAIVRAGRKIDFPCLPITYTQDITYTLPAGWTARLPVDVDENAGPVEYSARYTQDGQTVEARRHYVLKTRESVCPASLAATMAPVIKAALHDSHARLVIVPSTTAPATRN